MAALIEETRMSQDSVGGIVECAVTGLPAGIGGPLFGGIEPVLSSILFGIPAVKGVEFGDGFGSCALRVAKITTLLLCSWHGENNDQSCRRNPWWNHHGMPLLFRVGIKPTASISQNQQSVNLQTGENQIPLRTRKARSLHCSACSACRGSRRRSCPDKL